MIANDGIKKWKQAVAETKRHQRGMASMPEKKVFRARVLDPNKRLEVRIRQKCRQEAPQVNRTMAPVPPSGMEKEEEMESHLQQAIFAQKASSAGVNIENHVIPTPKVYSIDPHEYQKTYKSRIHRTPKLIKFRDFVSFFLNQSVYDADSEDEEWLRAKENICIDYFEQIILKLEMASQSADAIIQPMEAKALLQRYNSQIIDDVYDYWLQKRRQAASMSSKYGSVLIPKLNTDGNLLLRREEKATINPYIAFRRRLDKVQTRKKQKTEIQTYEKILRLNYALKRSIALAETVKLREKTKLALVDFNEDIFAHQYAIGDHHNQELDRITTILQPNFRIPELPSNSLRGIASPSTGQFPSSPNPKKRSNMATGGVISPSIFENGVAIINKNNKYSSNSLSPSFNSLLSEANKQKSRFSKYKVGLSDSTDPLNIASDAWIKRNIELWNRILPTVSTTSNVSSMENCCSITSNSVLSDVMAGSMGVYSLLEAQKLAKIDVNSSADGLYQFSRKAGCRYRPPNSILSTCVNRQQQQRCEDELATTTTTTTTILWARRRIGRGGRVIFDLNF